jgi:hypothetical protein
MSRLLCPLDRHKPDYASIQTEDNAFSADCRWCDKDIVKRHRGRWRRRKDAAPANGLHNHAAHS